MPYNLDIALLRRGEKEGLLIGTRMIRVAASKTGLLGRVVDVVLWRIRMVFPAPRVVLSVIGIVEPIPNFDLNHDIDLL